MTRQKKELSRAIDEANRFLEAETAAGEAPARAFSELTGYIENLENELARLSGFEDRFEHEAFEEEKFMEARRA